jgi:hypothetical protein
MHNDRHAAVAQARLLADSAALLAITGVITLRNGYTR